MKPVDSGGDSPFVVLSTCGSAEEARTLASALVEEFLAACVNVVPQVESVYRWHGKVERASEWLLVIKTTAAKLPALQSRLKELHSYELPECIALRVAAGSEEYLGWIAESVKRSPDE